MRRFCLLAIAWVAVSALSGCASTTLSSAVSTGSDRTRTPVAAKIALPMAGPTTVVAGSPRPTGASVDGTKLMSATLEEAREAMGMPWASWNGCREAIPPAYTKFIGEQLVSSLAVTARTPNPNPKD